MPVLTLILQICLLQKGPQRLPASWPLAAVFAATYVAAGVGAQTLITPEGEVVAPVLLDTALTAGLALLALRAHGHSRRGPETVTALLGTGTVFTLAALPLLQVIGDLPAGDAAPAPVVLLWLALVVWSFVVTAHILRHSLSVSYSVGLLWATLFLAASVAVFGLVFGAQS